MIQHAYQRNSILGLVWMEIVIMIQQLFQFITFPLLNTFNYLYIKEHYINLSNSDHIRESTHHKRRLKIVHLTDFHFDYRISSHDKTNLKDNHFSLFEKFVVWWGWLRRNIRYHRISKAQLKEILLEIENISNIDLIIITGDVFEDFSNIDIDWMIENFMSKLKNYCSLGVYGVLGNHDERYCSVKDREFLIKKLSTAITILDAQSEFTRHKFFTTVTKATDDTSFDIEIYGFLDFYNSHFWENYHKIVKHLNENPVKENTLRFLLSHNPDTIAWIKNDVFHFDMIFSGHTHGGQVCCPIPSLILKNMLALFWRIYMKDVTFDHFLQIHFSFEQVHQMNEGVFTYIPIIPIIIYLYKKATLWTFVRHKISKLKIVQRVLNVCKYWEWGTGLFELKWQDDSTLIDRVFHHHQKVSSPQQEINIASSEDENFIKLIFRTYKIDRKQFVHTSGGLGTHYPMRLFCPPEISILNLSF
ncbi:hypothetical protein C9374_008692 [Naegleria lovaniensis]|uniref:Calcineurin-like phosphoesterase domain-containing protein n=1 Tax=Naegleria lovaniensis TaxID=51637 RepID=A0AA88KFT7_NAELO|nr:uncharacterized protein C9374_008692 [Naegleria lovaniensis]KAG2378070.1 hypothetical protein C9374_008692 [Naegleria lovaniensis]